MRPASRSLAGAASPSSPFASAMLLGDCTRSGLDQVTELVGLNRWALGIELASTDGQRERRRGIGRIGDRFTTGVLAIVARLVVSAGGRLGRRLCIGGLGRLGQLRRLAANRR